MAQQHEDGISASAPLASACGTLVACAGGFEAATRNAFPGWLGLGGALAARSFAMRRKFSACASTAARMRAWL
jgi:hypothetical protein